MPRTKVYETVPISIKLTRAQIDLLKSEARKRSFEKRETITVSSLVRDAIESKYGRRKDGKKKMDERKITYGIPPGTM